MGSFREEMGEHLQVLIRELLILESHPEDLSPVGELFRRVHTVKGSARMMGFAEVAELAHSMEDILDDLRSGCLRPSSPLLDAMLTAADLLKELIGSAPEELTGRQDVQAVIRWLADLRGLTLDGESQAGSPIPPAMPLPEAPPMPVVRQGREAAAKETVRVDVDRIDIILNLAGELMVLDAARRQWMDEVGDLFEALERNLGHSLTVGSDGVVESALALVNVVGRSNKRFRKMLHQQTELVRELHYQISGLRMLPVSALFSLVPRAARDLAREEEKELEVLLEGEDTEIDRQVLERVRDPVMHLIMNAVVHGIESPAARVLAGKSAVGKVRVAAYSRGEQAIVEVEDDGAGIDFRVVREMATRKGILTAAEADALDDSECARMLFLPGFSTSRAVSGRSGRGVGLDVVRSEMDSLKGLVWLESKLGCGTKVTLELPITLAYTHVLLMETGKAVYGLPCSSVRRITEVSADQIRTLQGRESVELEGQSASVARLDQLLGTARAGVLRASRWPALLMGPQERPTVLLVDRVIGDENVIVKPMGPLLRRVPSVSGGIILGDGKVVLLLSAPVLLETARGVPSFSAPAGRKLRRGAKRVLVVDDVATTRELERGILETAGYRVETAVDGLDALEKLSAGQFELVVADVEMPRMDGFQLAAAIKGNPSLARIPIVIVSSREGEDDRRRGIQAGAQAYVGKGSFDQVTLLDTIDSLIG